MKIRVERDALADAVSWSTRALPARPTSMVLSGILLRASGDRVELFATDAVKMASATLDAVVDEPDSAVVSGRLLADIARSLPRKPVSLTLEANRLVVSCGHAVFRLPTLPLEDYPPLLTMPDTVGSVAGPKLAAAVAQVAMASSRDEAQPILVNLRVEMTADSITMAATDRYRLAVRSVPWQPNSSSFDVKTLVHAKTFMEMAKPLETAESVEMALSEETSRIGLSGAGRQSMMPLSAGEFPKYRQLLPADSSTVAVVSNEELREAVKRVKLVNDRSAGPLRLRFADGSVVLRAGSGDDPSAVEELECELQGESLEINFNPDYLADGLAAVGSGPVRLALTQPNRPALISCADEESDSDFRYLLMPMSIGS